MPRRRQPCVSTRVALQNRPRAPPLAATPTDQVMSQNDDVLHRFLLEDASVRGVLVRLSETWTEVAGRAEYPPALRDLLAQSLAASALLTGNVQFNGSLSLQLKSGGPVKLL